MVKMMISGKILQKVSVSFLINCLLKLKNNSPLRIKLHISDDVELTGLQVGLKFFLAPVFFS